MLFRRIFIVIKVLGYYGSSDGGQGTSDVGVTGAKAEFVKKKRSILVLQLTSR